MQTTQGTPLTSTELETLLGFIGYGRLDAPVWFLGMEEAGGDEDNLRRRTRFAPVMDLKAAHLILDLPQFFMGEKPVIQRTWWGMCQVMLRLLGRPTDRESIRTYQVQHLGRSKDNTLLLELMPIPKPTVGGWGYEGLIPQYASRQVYYDSVKTMRIRKLKELAAEHQPRLVLAYGRAFWPDYRELFPRATWAEKVPFCFGQSGATTVILMDHMVAIKMNRRWGELVDLIRAGCPDLPRLLQNNFKERL